MRPIRMTACACTLLISLDLRRGCSSLPGFAAPAAGQMAPFHSVELRNGGEVFDPPRSATEHASSAAGAGPGAGAQNIGCLLLPCWKDDESGDVMLKIKLDFVNYLALVPNSTYNLD